MSSCVIDEETDVARHFSSTELSALFEYNKSTVSDTHDKLKCKRCMNGRESIEPPPTADTNSDLSLWYHNTQKDARKLPDQILRAIYDSGVISFIFHQKSHEQVKQINPKKKDDDSDKENEADKDYNPDSQEHDD